MMRHAGLLILAVALALAAEAFLPHDRPAQSSPAPAPVLKAAVGSAGVRLTWTPMREVTVWRSTSREGLEKGDTTGYPVSRWRVPAAAGHWDDRDVADGVTYYYKVEGAIAEATTPTRALPALKKPAFAIDKAAYVLTVLDGATVAKRYPIALGRAPQRRKLTFDNASTPEGRYHIVGLQPKATYYKAYDLDYPNALDRARYQKARGASRDFPPIGGEIQIHGLGIDTNWTFGCIALRNADMDELFASPAIARGVEVLIWGGELTKQDAEEAGVHTDL